MDFLRQCASTAAGRQTRPSTEDKLDVALVKPAQVEGKDALPSDAPLKAISVDVYSGSNSTTSSSSAVSSGRSSPVSSSTATSNFYFYLEDEEEWTVGGGGASEMIRNFSSALHKDFRGRPPWKGGNSLNTNEQVAARSNSASDDHALHGSSLPLRERSPMHPHYTFPLRTASGWSSQNSLTFPASAPVSAAESRRGSTQVGRPKSTSSVSGPLYRGSRSNDPNETTEEPANVSSTMIIDKPEASATPEQDLLGDADVSKTGIVDMELVPSSSPRQRPGPRQTEDVCEVVLRRAFNVDLQDLGFAGDALESVARCLEELSSVVYSDRSLELAMPLRSVPEGDPESGTSDGPRGESAHNGPLRKGRGKRRAGSNDNRKEEGEGKGQDGKGDQDDPPSEDEGSSPARSKKIRVEPPDNRYPCPYRKRNPLKFNVRDYNTCATASFSDFTNLKRHIKLYHRRQARLPYVCFRCGIDQETRDRLMAHVQLPPDKICAVRQEARDADPEEGITQEVEDVLNERKSKVKIDSWPGLWQALFGCEDDVLPSNFEPPVEWDEVKAEFEGTREILKNRVHLESLTIKELRPEAQGYVAAHMDHTCWDYIGSVLSASRLQADYHSEKHHRRRRSQKSNASALNPTEEGLLPPTTQRHILPKPSASEEGVPVGAKNAVVVSNGSSLSSSWETAISNVSSSSNLMSTSSSTSMATPGELLMPPFDHKLPSLCPPGSVAAQLTRMPLAAFVGDGDVGCDMGHGTHVAAGNDAFAQYASGMDDDGEYALQEGLECLFGYEDYDDEIGLGGCNGYEQSGPQFGLGG